MQSNKLSLNETKTELIIFRSPWKHLPGEPDIRINNYKFKLHSHMKYLGILIDKVLSWNKKIDYICTKLPRGNFIVSKLCHFVPKKHEYQYISLYFTLMTFMVVWSSPTQPNAIYIESSNCKNSAKTYLIRINWIYGSSFFLN